MRKDDIHSFSLEDILREFGEEPKKEAPAVTSDTIPIPRVPTVTSDTIRLDAIPKELTEEAPVTGDTVRLDAIQKAVRRVSPTIPQETAVFGAVRIADEPEKPKTEEWTPTFEEPMEDLPIPEPIIFRPKSRLQELRQKLIAGPEKRYYELTEKGVGKLRLSAVLCLLVCLLSAGAVICYAFGIFPENRLRLLVFGQFLGLLVSALLGSYLLLDGITDALRLRFGTNSLLALTFIACCVDGVLCLEQLRIPLCCLFCLEMTVALHAEQNRRTTEIGQMDTMRRATNLEAVAVMEDYYEGRPGYGVIRGEVEHFWENYKEPSTPERLLGGYALAVALLSIAVGVLGGVFHGLSVGVQVCVGAMVAGMPVTAWLSATEPMAILEKRLHKLGAVLCGWKGVQAVKRHSAYPLGDNDLFPSGAAKLNGVKFYGDRDPDEVVEYATALIKANGGTLVSLFRQLLESRNGYSYEAKHLHHYGNGIGGEVREESVVLGTLECMQDMGVEMKKGLRVNQALYCAIDGELCGVFAVAYSRAKSSAAGVRTLCGYRGLTPVITCGDFMLTESFIRNKFSINTRRMAFPGRDVRLELQEKEPAENAPVVALTTKEGLAPKAFAITGARVLASSMRAGVAIAMAGGILGILIMAALAYVGPQDLLSPWNLLLYELVWAIPGILVTQWTRTL